jgi:outer membrane protein TolC
MSFVAPEDDVIAIPLLVVVSLFAPDRPPADDRHRPAVADADASAPPLEALVAEALEQAPSVAALQARLAGARELVGPAGVLPDPTVELMLQNIGLDRWTVGEMDMSMVAPEVRQGLSYPGKRRARTRAAEALVAVAAADVEALRRAVAAEVRLAYARTYALDRERDTLAAAAELLDLLAETAAARYGVGEADQEAVVKAQIEASRLSERLDDLEAERAGVVAILNRLLDRPGAAPLAAIEALPPVRVEIDGIELAALERSPEVATVQAAVGAAEQRLEVARLDLRPDLFAGAAFGYRGDLDPAVVLRFGAELPLRRRSKQEPLLRAAEREVDAARADLRDTEAAVRATAARLAAEWRRAERQITRYREAIVPQSSAAVDSARASYLAGRGDFSTVIEDFRLWLGARAELARREAERFVTWAEIERLVGSPPAEREGDAT